MTFNKVDEIICSYGFYKYCNDQEENSKSKYYMYPGIDILAIYIENFEERLHKELKNFKSSLESLLQEQKIFKIKQKLEKIENDFND